MSSKPRQHFRSVFSDLETPRVKIQIGGCVVNALVDSGAGRSLINNHLFSRLKQSGDTEISFCRDVGINLVDINDKCLTCTGTIKTSFFVTNERPSESLQQEFVVVHGIMEECVLGLDALYQHNFVIDGHKKRVYRVRGSDQSNNRRDPVVVIQKQLVVPPFSACIMESGGTVPNSLPAPHSFLRTVQLYRQVLG
jgi:hypothetical protein